MTKLKDGNFTVIQAFMINDLNLKGNELIIYAVIYGFSQTENQCFTGGLQYLADWTNSTKQGVLKNLKSLIEKGYIGKREKYINNVKFCEYYSTKFNGVLNNVECGVLNKVEQGMQQSSTNNISDNKNNDNTNIKKIIAYLNERAGTHYRADTDSTRRHIKARFNEGFTIDDFFTVINKKVEEWQGTQMEKYLRPETLFGTKFESYLNARERKTNVGANGIQLDGKQSDELDGIL